MVRTELNNEDINDEINIKVAQIIIDGYASGDSGDGQLTGLIIKGGDTGSTTFIIGADDGYLKQSGSGDVTFKGFTKIENNIDIEKNLRVNMLDNGQNLSIKSITVTEAIGTSKTHSSSLSIPAGAEVVGVSTYVITKPTGTTSFSIGVSGSKFSLKRYGNNISTNVSSSNNGSETPGQFYKTSHPIILTFNTAPSGGSVRITLHYKQIVAPTS